MTAAAAAASEAVAGHSAPAAEPPAAQGHEQSHEGLAGGEQRARSQQDESGWPEEAGQGVGMVAPVQRYPHRTEVRH